MITFGVASINPRKESFSPSRENFSLKADDIPGAVPRKYGAISKKFEHYGNRLRYDTSNCQENLEKQPVFNSHEFIFGGEYKTGMAQISKNGKKHFGHHYRSEIKNTNAIQLQDMEEPAGQTFDYPRNLNTNDIPGAVAGTVKTKGVANHELAQKMRRGGPVQKERPGLSDISHKQVEDSLDRFQQERIENRTRRQNETDRAVNRSYLGGETIDKLLKDEVKEKVIEAKPNEKTSLNEAFQKEQVEKMLNCNERKQNCNENMKIRERLRAELSHGANEKLLKPEDNHYQNLAKSYNLETCKSDIAQIQKPSGQDALRLPHLDNSMRKETPYEQAYGNIYTKREDLKKVYTFNIISNQPVSKMLPSKARLPYRYALPFDMGQINPFDKSQTNMQNAQDQSNPTRAYDIFSQRNEAGKYEQNRNMIRQSYEQTGRRGASVDMGYQFDQTPVCKRIKT